MSIFSKIGAIFFDFIETIVIALSIFLVVYLFFMQPHHVNGQSMVPNFQSGEYLLTDKVTYRMRNPERGEVIVFHAPSSAHCAKGTGCDFIKRILAVPGESVEVKNNGIYINGNRLPESYIPDSYKTLAGEFSKNRVIELGDNEYFAVGDNRPYSSDSRAWGPIKKEDIVGLAFYRYWPVKVIGTITKASY
jgi:signal peptidase I